MINPKTTHLLIRNQEIALKGKNRPEFERRLRNNLAKCLGDCGTISNASGRFVIALSLEKTKNLSTLVDRLASISGVAAVTPCAVTDANVDRIRDTALNWAE